MLNQPDGTLVIANGSGVGAGEGEGEGEGDREDVGEGEGEGTEVVQELDDEHEDPPLQQYGVALRQ